MINDLILQSGPYLLAAAVIGGILGWLIGRLGSSRSLNRTRDKWQIKFDEAAAQRDKLHAENSQLRTSIEAQQAVVHKHELAVSGGRTELESANEKIRSLSKETFTLGAECDDLRNKMDNSQNALQMANHQLTDLEAEFVKSGKVYKGELEKSFGKRKELEKKVEDVKQEHESLTNLLEASRSENESVSKMMAAAQTRLDNLDALEAKGIKLEAENAQLKHDDALARQEVESLRRDVADLDELKIQNRELAQCLTSMESSRKQYEIDAKRYRAKADQSEQRSDTLSMKLDDVEKSFAEIAQKHDQALKVAKNVPHAAETEKAAEQEIDDLTEIVGIGKAFQQTLHDLGVFSYRQIAAFGPADVARVNMELNEFKGRMEQDDWIGQAKELYFRKYGETA